MEDVRVFGRPGCPYTIKAVDELVQNGISFSYRSLPGGMTREEFWQTVQGYAPNFTLQRTFPTIIVRKPTTQIFGSEGAAIIASSKQGPGRSRQIHNTAKTAMVHGHNFVVI